MRVTLKRKRQLFALAREIPNIFFASVRFKFYAVFVGLTAFVLVLIFVSVYSVREQSVYHHKLDASSQAASNVEKVNGLIFAIVMESRGIYMSSDGATVRRYGQALLRRNAELGEAMDQWQRIVGDDDRELFAAFKARISEFIAFREELVRRAYALGQGAGRAWGDNEANRQGRTALNEDLAALATVYFKRGIAMDMLGKQVEFTTLLLMILGIGAIALTFLAAILLKSSVIDPLVAITSATDAIASGRNLVTIRHLITIPYASREDEIGRLALAVQQLQATIEKNRDLENQNLSTSRQRKQLEDNEVHLTAAIGNLAQGLIMLDMHANVILMNEAYRTMYHLPETLKSGCHLRDILRHRTESGLFSGDTSTYVRTIMTRIARGQPSVSHINLKDGRKIHVFERPTPDGGWVATHEDFTKQEQLQRALERRESLFATIVESLDEAVLAEDALSHRYVFVNRAAEVLFGLPRDAMIQRTATDALGEETAKQIEGASKTALAKPPADSLHTITTPGNGTRIAAIRHLIAPGEEGSTYLISIIEDRTDQNAPLPQLRAG